MSESLLERRLTQRKLTAGALTEIGESLADVDWRLLHWLLHYPLQRADDLVVGVARWASRATVHRHVHALEARGLVESVLPKTPGTGKRLYYLSNLGIHLLARHLEKPARQLARTWQADEVGLLRLLPRLPTLLVLQDVVNGLVTHAADAMTTQGRRPRLVRWNWQRDVTHSFQYREQRMRFFADGVLALCIRPQQGESGVQDQWYGLFILSTELDDERLMRLRLERLLCWRESPERWPFYQHMLLVLILARSQRQCDHWKRAIEATSLKLRLDPLVGALAYLPPQESAHINPWLLNWRTVATDVPCHLQEWLRTLPHAVFPSWLRLEESEGEERHVPVPSKAIVDRASHGKAARLSGLLRGDLAHRAAQLSQAKVEEQEVIALLGLHLTPCQWSILRLLLAYPLLSDEELAAFLSLQQKSLRCSLYDLHQLGCLEPISTEAGKRWHFCGRGLRLVAAANHVHIRNFAALSDDGAESEATRVGQRGEDWLLQRIRHTAGIYGFFAKLALAARQEPEHTLCWWETGPVCERRYRVGEQWYNLKPDAQAEYHFGSQQIRFWLEWDRGTMNARDLAVKFTSYAHYIASREWAREGARLPKLLCVVPDISQERRMQRVAQTRIMSPTGLDVWTTTDVLLSEHGLLAPIWLQGMPHRNQDVQSGGSRRQSLPDIALSKKGT